MSGRWQVLHALAALNVDDEQLVERLLAMALRKPLHLFSAHRYARISTSTCLLCYVLGLFRHSTGLF
jgi:hypothetical protein